MTTHRARLRLAAATTIAVLVLAPAAPAIAGRLPVKRFGPAIDSPAGYQGQSKCDPHVKRGVVAFRKLVMKAFPTTGEGYFTRPCSIGGQSEHKDGRAWDWMVSYYSRSDRQKVETLFRWLFEKDARGRRFARARRLGIMYLIWNKRIWSPWEGWRAYTGSSPHRDHVHFSFSWPGARKKTSFWHQDLTFVTGASANTEAPGFWSTTGNGVVLTAGSSAAAGDLGRGFGLGKVAAIASTPSGNGYWLVKQGGGVFAFGDARRRGSFAGEGLVTDVVAAPRGSGYWIVAKSGRVEAFGSADHFGNENSAAQITAMASTPSGDGYWLVSNQGRVFAFGDAESLGEIKTDSTNVVDIEAREDAQGYWLVTRAGRVTPFGVVGFAGDARRQTLRSPIVSLVDTPDGQGYWLVNADGRAFDFGSAADVQPHSSNLTNQSRPGVVPTDAAPTETLFVERYLLGREVDR